MSKKKSKPVAKKAAARKAASRKAASKKTAKASVSASTAGARLMSTAAAATGRTLHTTIFLHRTGNGNRIRTAPQRLYANPGDFVEWTVVNLIDGTDAPVTLTWPDGGPWGKDPIEIRGWERKAFGDAPAGVYKFVVSAFDVQEDPEVELPDGN